MLDRPASSLLTYRQCRSIAHAVRNAPRGCVATGTWSDGRRGEPGPLRGRTAIRVIRPPGLGLFRARPPLAALLCLADREGRLVWESAEAFAVIEPPIARAAAWAAGPNSFRTLAWVTTWWQQLVLLVPCVLIMAAAIPVAFASPIAALAMLAVMSGYLVLDLGAGVVRIGIEIVRQFTDSGPHGDGPLGGELRSYQWTMTLCHVTDEARVEPLLRGALDRATELTATALPRDPAFGTVLLACRASCATSPETRHRLERSALTVGVGEADWLVIGSRGPVKPPEAVAVRPIRIIPLLLAAPAIAVAVAAQFVVAAERAACATEACGTRPVTYAKAVEWLLRHVLWQFPGPATWQSRTLGVLTMVLLPLFAACVVVALVQHQRYQTARKKLMYKVLDQHHSQRTSVLVLVVNEIERDAVIAAVARHPDRGQPLEDRVGKRAVFRLGQIGSADVILAQSEQGTVGSGGMTVTAGILLDKLGPTAAILTGICYGLKSRQLDGGTQELGDLIVSTQLRALDHKKVTVGPDGERLEFIRGPRPESAQPLLSLARAATQQWPGPPVHFGPVASLNTLLDNEAERRQLKQVDPEAIGGEMELAGLAAAAARTKTDWLLVKGISDWGAGKTDDHQEQAARNAGDFVVRLIERLAPAD